MMICVFVSGYTGWAWQVVARGRPTEEPRVSARQGRRMLGSLFICCCLRLVFIRISAASTLRWYRMGVCCEKKIVIGLSTVCSMKLRVPDPEVDQRGLWERSCKKTVKYVKWTGGMLWIVVDGGSWLRMIDDHDRFEWVNFFYRLTWVVPNKWPKNGCFHCCCCFYSSC